MVHRRKLKPDKSIFGPIQPVIVLILFGLTLVIWDIKTALILLIFVYLFYFTFTMYAVYRVRNYYYFLAGFFQIMVAVFLTFNKIGPIPLSHDMIKGISILLISSGAMAAYVLIAKKLKWWGREIFELAAQDVEIDPETFTERPKPYGKIVYQREDLFGFAHFYQKNLLGLCKREDSTLIFIPVKMNGWANALYHPSFNYKDHSYVAISFDGRVSTFISKKDYLDYKEDLAFDQLTEALSNLHLDFFDWYQAGKEVRIMDRIKEVEGNIFT
jgi:hypothetical protein